VFNLLFALSVVITPLYLYSILKIVSMFGTEDLVSNIRTLALFGNEQYGYLALSYVLNQALLIIALWRYPRIPLWKLLTVYCMTLMNAFAIMEKGMLFYVVIITLFVGYEKRLLRMRSVMLTLASIVLLFFVINLFRAGDSTYSEETTLTDFLVMYVLSPPAAFSTLSPDISLQLGSHTFHDIYHLLSKYGFGNFVVHERTQDFVFVPISTNVYTIFQSFYEDFKYQGVAFFALVYGLFSGWMYRLYQNGNAVGKVIYTFLIYVLVLQFFQEYIFQSFIQFGQFVFFVLLVHQNFLGFNLKYRQPDRKRITDIPSR
jgi:oligosaccharide repeat unit polymerase